MFKLPQRSHQVLGVDMNCSESCRVLTWGDEVIASYS